MFSALQRAAIAALVCAAAAGCSSDSTTSPSTTTETVSGSLAPGNTNYHAITITNTGNLTVVLSSLTPTSTATVGVGLGTLADTVCTIGYYNAGFKVGTTWTTSLTGTGSMCVAIYDVGTLTETQSYTLSITHP